jgi:hypothetical protein
VPFVAADSFTTQAHVESRLGRGAFDGSSVPTQQQVLDFMALRSSRVRSVLVAAGLSFTVPNGGATIGTSTADALTLTNLCDDANALFAAGDAAAARDIHDGKESPQAVALWAEAQSVIEDIRAQATKMSFGTATSGARSATTTGGITKADFNETGQGAEIPRSSLFNSSTNRW